MTKSSLDEEASNWQQFFRVLRDPNRLRIAVICLGNSFHQC